MSDEQEIARLQAIDDQMDGLFELSRGKLIRCDGLLGDVKSMKLTDLNPRWVGLPGPIYDGVAFDCPHCRTQRLAIIFTPPIDPNGWWPKINQPTYANQLVWKRSGGDTFETLTISPSVDASNPIEFKNHWHGHITNGQVT